MHKYLLFFLLLFICTDSFAQIALPPASPLILNTNGGTGSLSANYIIDWSVGEATLIETYFGNNGSTSNSVGTFWNVTSGVLQPFDKLYKPTRPTWLPDEVIIYPIPAVGIITINIQSFAAGKLLFQLVTQEGKILGTTSIDKNSFQLIEKTDLTRLSAGVYYIKLVLENSSGDKIKSGAFKIIKERK
jgi:hypothetical protein